MKDYRKPVPKSQAELYKDTVHTYTGQGGPGGLNPNKRAEERSLKNSDVKQFAIGLQDIDHAIDYYFKNVIRPRVQQNKKMIEVPILYGSPERWKAVQKDGYYRDKNGKIQTPLIMFKRDSVNKNRDVGNKLDANNVRNFGVFKKRYSQKNQYDRFDILNNRVPVEEYYGVAIPDYVNIEYTCRIFTDYISQTNKLIEAINFASDSYWGDPKRFRFQAKIDSFTPVVEVVQGEDRVVKTEFKINLLGHIIADTLNASKANMSKFYSKAAVNFKFETSGTQEELVARARTAEKEAATRFFDSFGQGNMGGSGRFESRLSKDISTDREVGGSKANTVIPKGTTFTEYIELVHKGIFKPDLVDPSFSLVNNVGNLAIIGQDITFNLMFNFNRGQIVGERQGSVWNPAAIQGPRAGEAEEYVIDGQNKAVDTLQKENYIVKKGENTFTGTVTYKEGQQPVDSGENPFENPLPAGTSPEQTTSFEGVYPIFATSENINNLTQQPLASMENTQSIEIDLVKEVGGKHRIAIPMEWLSDRPVKELQYFNTITDKYDTTNQITSWETLNEQRTIAGNSVPYMVFTHKGVDAGERRIKLIF